jgi:hypothetical protein
LACGVCTPETLGRIVRAIGQSLGETRMDDAGRAALIAAVIEACALSATQAEPMATVEEAAAMTRELCAVLRIADAPAVAAELMRAVAASNATLPPQYAGTMMSEICGALLGPGISDGNREALFRALVAPGLPAEQRGAMLQAVCRELNIANREEHRTALIRAILQSKGTLSAAEMGLMMGVVLGFLTEADITDRGPGAAIALILRSGANPAQMCAMMHCICAALGGSALGGERLNALLAHFFDARAVLSLDQTMAVMKGLTLGYGGIPVSEGSVFILATVVQSWRNALSTRQMAMMVHGMCLALGGPEISEPIRNLLIGSVLDGGATFPQKLAMLQELRRSLHRADGSLPEAHRAVIDRELTAIQSEPMGRTG